jgi:ribosomal protein S18 acetylase RimI-like enzyme
MSTSAHPPARSRLTWVPIRSLAARHRPRILRHLLALDSRDRYLRFGYAASDEQVEHYVDGLDFERDEVFGVFNRRLDVIAMAHLAYEQAADGAPDTSRIAEFGVSVSAASRGRGFGGRLFDHAVLHARNRGIDTLTISALSENTTMLRIARSAGATVSFEGPDALAHLKLPPEDLASHVEAMVGNHAAEFDYSLKVQARRIDAWLDLFTAR